MNETNTLSPSIETEGNFEEESDFIDFYRILGTSPEAPASQLRQSISDLYAEAQNNRDHRSMNKRLHFEALCELLPYARMVLLHPEHKLQYDVYLQNYKTAPASIPDFTSIIQEILGQEIESPEDISDLLAIAELNEAEFAVQKSNGAQAPTVETAKSNGTHKVIEAAKMPELEAASSGSIQAQVRKVQMPVTQPENGSSQEPVKAEPVKAEPVKAEPVKAEPIKAEPVKAEPVSAETGSIKVAARSPKPFVRIALGVLVLLVFTFILWNLRG